MILYDQEAEMQRRMQKHIDKHQKALIVEHNIYLSDNATVVIFTKLYQHFALGYVENKSNGAKMPYTLTYKRLICHDFDDESQWDDGSKLWE